MREKKYETSKVGLYRKYLLLNTIQYDTNIIHVERINNSYS